MGKDYLVINFKTNVNFTKIILLLSFFLVCTPIKSSFSDDAGVIRNFQDRIDKHFKSYDLDSREKVSKLGGGWANQRYKANRKYKFDIKRTDSIVSPYTAEIKFNLEREFTDFHPTKEAAQKDTVFIRSDLTDHSHSYVYQNEKWIVVGREHRSADAQENFNKFGKDYFLKWFDCNEIIDEGENKGEEDIFGCWEKEMDTNFE